MRTRPKPLTDEEGEVRELTLADFRKMKPVREAMPGLIEAVESYRRKGRPKAEAPKVHIGSVLRPIWSRTSGRPDAAITAASRRRCARRS